MTTIDDVGRRAATVARADAAEMAAARVEAGLRQLRLEEGPTVVSPRRVAEPRRWIAVGIAAALVAAAIIALVVNANESESHRLVPADESTQPSPQPTSRAVATTTLPETAPADTAPAVTTQEFVNADPIAVSHDALPPAFAPTVLLGITDQSRCRSWRSATRTSCSSTRAHRRRH